MKKPLFLKQNNMKRVLYALSPVCAAGIYYFGWRVAAVLAVSLAAGFLTEWIMASSRNGKISYACFVTATLYALSLPPTVPLWIAATGAIVAILFGKEVFGGFGKNVFNPAIVGRAFVYVCFPLELTSRFVPAFTGFPAGLARWSFETLKYAPDYITAAGLSVVDGVTAATPMLARRDFGHATGLVQQQERLGPSKFSGDGFLGADRRPVEAIIADDERALADAGVTCGQVAGRLREIWHAAEEAFGAECAVGTGLTATLYEAKGRIPCPFPGHGVFPKGEAVVRHVPTGTSIAVTPLSIHLIDTHHFFQGRGSVYRIEPDWAAKHLL